MGIKKRSYIDLNQAKSKYNHFIEELYSVVKPYMNSIGKLNLDNSNFIEETCILLALILEAKIAFEDNKRAIFFGADDILAKQVIIENNKIKYWGIIYWLQKPHDYEINQTGKDPFYAEFSMQDTKLYIEKMMFGDFDKTNLDKIWWFDKDLNWIYVFES